MFSRATHQVAALALVLGFAVGAYIYADTSNALTEARYFNQLQEHCKEKVSDYSCLEPFVNETIRTEGLAEGLTMIKVWYMRTPKFRPYCDAFTRYVGGAAYKKIPNYETLEYTEESVWCNYGFFHGYMQAYMADVADTEKGAVFCTYIGEKLRDSAPGAQSECFRALGYAIVLLTGTEEKDVRVIADTSVRGCEEHAKDSLDVRLCVEGVFSELGQIIATGDYGSVSAENPLWLCDRQSADTQPLCYATMKWLPFTTFNLRGDDIGPGFKKIEERYSEQELLRLNKTIEQLVFVLAYNQARRGTALPALENYQGGIDACTSLPDAFVRQCISGFAFGLSKGGVPGEQYHEVFDFCKKAAEIPSYPADNCAPSSLQYFERYYSRELFNRVCKKFEETFGNSCTGY